MDVLTPEERAAHNEAQGDDGSPKITYRHNRIARFSIDHKGTLFAFRDHILTIPAHLESKFKEAYRNMLPQDQASIVKLKVTDNETGVLDPAPPSSPGSSAVRGPVSTTQIPGNVNQQATGAKTAAATGNNPLAGLIKPPAAS